MPQQVRRDIPPQLLEDLAGCGFTTIYRQFSLSLVSAMLLSVFLAMSLTPALCATLLKPIEKGHKHEKRGFFGWFNRGFAASTSKYQSWVAGSTASSTFAVISIR